MQRFWSTLLAILFSLLFFSLSMGLSHATPTETSPKPASLSSTQQELQRAKRQLLESQQQTRQQEKNERSVLTQLESLNRRRNQLRRDARHTAQQLQTTHEQVDALRRTHDQWSHRVQQQRHHLSQRLRQLYKMGQRPYAKLLLSARNVMNYSRKVHYIQHLANYDQQQLRDFNKAQAEVASAQASLMAAEQRLRAQQATLRQQQAALDHERQQKSALLKRVRTEKQLAEQTVTEYTETVQALKGVIEQLHRTRQQEAKRREAARRVARRQSPKPRSDHPKTTKGQLYWPVHGPVLSGFGRVRHPSLDVYTVHKGMYIGASLDSPVKAAESGRVVYADWFKGLGQLLIIDHGNHLLTLYGHTSDLSVEVGDEVRAHQRIAKVGDSSTLDTPALYFAIRYNTAPQDPTEWLRQQSASLTQEP